MLRKNRSYSQAFEKEERNAPPLKTYAGEKTMVKIELYNNLSSGDITQGVSYKITAVEEIPEEEIRYNKKYAIKLVDTQGNATKNYLPNKTSLYKLAEAFGGESDMWINQFITFVVAKSNIDGKLVDVLYAEPSVTPNPAK